MHHPTGLQFRHVGKLEDGDSCEQAVEKIQNALKGRGNQTPAVHKLFCSMVQVNQTFDAWHAAQEGL